MPDYIAIGDIHGRDDLLADLLSQLPATGTLVFLGDYIDRGPASRQVIERLIAFSGQRACLFLRGNHEAMAMEAQSGDLAARQHWLRNGGMATLESYGGPIIAEHLTFLRRTLLYAESETHIFVHAGLRPGKTPATSDAHELLWIREPFLTSEYRWGKMVVHGHTPTSDGTVDIRENRINLDTGAAYGGPLTALLLPELEYRQAR